MRERKKQVWKKNTEGVTERKIKKRDRRGRKKERKRDKRWRERDRGERKIKRET